MHLVEEGDEGWSGIDTDSEVASQGPSKEETLENLDGSLELTDEAHADETPAPEADIPLVRQLNDREGASITSITFDYLITTMPIDIERFEEGPEESLQGSGPTNGEIILSFLASNNDKAFTPKEIHEMTQVPRGSVGVVLSRLEDRNLVRHRGEYWAIDPDADVEPTITALRTARAASDRLGAEDPDEWGPGLDPEDE